jgi:hypothetical protein
VQAPVILIGIHADEPGLDCFGRLSLKQGLRDLAGVAEALFGLWMRRSPSPHLLAYGLRIGDACDSCRQILTEDVVQRVDKREYAQACTSSMDCLLVACRSQFLWWRRRDLNLRPRAYEFLAVGFVGGRRNSLMSSFGQKHVSNRGERLPAAGSGLPRTERNGCTNERGRDQSAALQHRGFVPGARRTGDR